MIPAASGTNSPNTLPDEDHSSDSKRLLSLVVPVHNGEHFIAPSLRHIVWELDSAGLEFEIVVVCDGCEDSTAENARLVRDSRLSVIEHRENRGKGRAIMTGLAATQGNLVGWLDADLDIEAEAIVRATDLIAAHEADAAIGSKRHPDSCVVYPAKRRLFSILYQQLIKSLFKLNVSDTQVGAKVFRREVIEGVSPYVSVDRYAFDLEFLVIAKQRGYDRIIEMPVRLKYKSLGSGVNWAAAFRMLHDTITIARRSRRRRSAVAPPSAKPLSADARPPGTLD